MMTQEIYALAKDRSAKFATSFLDTLLPCRMAVADNYPVPECADVPTQVFQCEDQLFDFLEANPDMGYGLYWNSRSATSQISQAMLFYTDDGYLILGLAVDPQSALRILEELKRFASTEFGMVGSEQRPPETAQEFIALCQLG